MNIKSRWNELSTKRSNIIKRARDCAELTIPSLLPPKDHSEDEELYCPFQSIGTRGVNNVSSKLLLTLFPGGGSFFQLKMDDPSVTQATKMMPELQEAVEQQLLQHQQIIADEFEKKGMRVKLFQAIQLLADSGNCLLEIPDDDDIRVINMDQYVVVRNSAGIIGEIITKEAIRYDQLSDDIRMKLTADNVNASEKDWVLFTHILRSGKKLL